MPIPLTLPEDFAVAAGSGRPLLFLWTILGAALALPLLLTLNAHGSGRLGTASTWLGPALVLLTGAIVTAAYRRQRITLDTTDLTIRSTFYTRTVTISALRLEQARIVDLAEHTSLQPALRTNGYSLPGFRAGHFRMRGGGKVFCLVTDSSRVLVLPLLDGSTVLISPEHPHTLLDALRQLAGAPRPA